jgi:hypothetical protein
VIIRILLLFTRVLYTAQALQSLPCGFFITDEILPHNTGWLKSNGCEFMTQFGLLPVHTRFREKHIKLVQGNLLKQDVDQFVFSSFDGGYYPTPTSIWGSAKTQYFGTKATSNPDDLWGPPSQVGDTSVVTFETMEAFSQKFPLISLNMVGTDIGLRGTGENLEYSLRKSLFSLLFACRELSAIGKLGRIVGLPLLGTGDQGLPIPNVAKLLKQFAEDALTTIDTLDEIVICAFSESDANSLGKEFKDLYAQSPLLEKEKLPEWQQNTISSLIRDIKHLKHILPEKSQKLLMEVLARFSNDSLDKEGIATAARVFLQNALNATKNDNKLINKIDGLRSMGTPNIWVSHMHMIRIIGNTAAHSNDAVRRVSPEDLISLLMGLKEFTSAWPSIEANINATP